MTSTKEFHLDDIRLLRELESVYDDQRDKFEGFTAYFEIGASTITTRMPWRLVRWWFRVAGVTLYQVTVHII